MNKSLDDILAVAQIDPGDRGLFKDPTDNLLTATVGDFERACRTIAEQRDPAILIVTGFTIPSVDPPCGETDGPLGALFLQRCFQLMKIPVTIATDGTTISALQSMAPTIALPDLPHDTSPAEYLSAIRLLAPPFNIAIAIERVGPAADGRCYSMRGRDMTDLTHPAHLLFEGDHDYTTIGIGDGGNEIGMGKVPTTTIAKNIPDGNKVACRVRTNHLIVAGISNWGAYALAAGVCSLRNCRPPHLLFDPIHEQRNLENLIQAGPLIDGVTGQPTLSVDGLPFVEYATVLPRIAAIIGA